MFLSLKREEFLRSFYILKGMVLKNFRSKYGGSCFGLWWTLLEPLLLIVSVGFVFTFVFDVPTANFPLFLLSGILMWVYLSSVLNDAMVSIVVNAPAVKQFNFAKIIFPVSHVITSLGGLCAGMLVLLPIFIYFNNSVLIHILYLLPLLLFFVILTAGLSFILCIIYVFFRDILYIFHSFLMIWFWLTPIFYELEMVPAKFRILSYLNPLTAFMECFRAILYYGKTPKLIEVFISCGSACLFIVIGFVVFVLFDKKIIKKI